MHYLIEYFRTSHNAGSKVLSQALINSVLPSVQEYSRKVIIAFCSTDF